MVKENTVWTLKYVLVNLTSLPCGRRFVRGPQAVHEMILEFMSCLRNITTKKITFDWHLAIHPLIVITRLASWRSWPLKIHKTDVWICSGLQPLQRSSLEFFFTKTRPDWTRKMTDEIKTINTGDLKKTKRAKIQTQLTASFFRQCPEYTESHKTGENLDKY